MILDVYPPWPFNVSLFAKFPYKKLVPLLYKSSCFGVWQINPPEVKPVSHVVGNKLTSGRSEPYNQPYRAVHRWSTPVASELLRMDVLI